jgi:deazaflavin-dependent oxidoreductase (nitroreductase family)
MKQLRRLSNMFMIRLLCSPLHRLASGSLLLITYHGRVSRRRFTIPVLYADHDGTLIIFVGHAEQKRWWRNVRDGAEVEVRLRGRRLAGQAEVVGDRATAATYLDRYPRARPAVEAAESPIFVRITALAPSDANRDYQ